MAYPTPLTLIGQALELEPTDITVTDPELDTTTGYYIREFRFYGEPASTGGSNPLILTIRVKSTDTNQIQVTAPASEF